MDTHRRTHTHTRAHTHNHRERERGDSYWLWQYICRRRSSDRAKSAPRAPENAPPNTTSRMTVETVPRKNGLTRPLRHMLLAVCQKLRSCSGRPQLAYFTAAIQLNSTPLTEPAMHPANQPRAPGRVASMPLSVRATRHHCSRGKYIPDVVARWNSAWVKPWYGDFQLSGWKKLRVSLTLRYRALSQGFSSPAVSSPATKPQLRVDTRAIARPAAPAERESSSLVLSRFDDT